jgi:hypothetical protein
VPDTALRTEFVYDVRYVLAPDGETAHTRRVTVVDPDPQPGMGPSLGRIHQALREAIGRPEVREELQLLWVRAPEDAEA